MRNSFPRRATSVLLVVLPVHDEEELLPGALRALERAIGALTPSISCRVAVVLDSCVDASRAIATSWATQFGALVIGRDYSSVGQARRTGFLALLERCLEVDLAQVWLATTDADSQRAARLAQGSSRGSLFRRGPVGGKSQSCRAERLGREVEGSLRGGTGSYPRGEPWLQRYSLLGSRGLSQLALR